MPDILFEDKHIIVAVKDAGILSCADEGKGESLQSILSDYTKSHGEKGEIFTVHRLDRQTSGIMVFAKDKKSAASVSSQITGDNSFGVTFKKEYSAVLCGKLTQKSGSLEDYLFKNTLSGMVEVCSSEKKGAKKAVLEYRVSAETEYKESALSLVKIKLLTGRTHQIRVQFSSRGFPLLGDSKYGKRCNEADLCLICDTLCFKHPQSGKELKFTLPLPDKFPYSLFGE